jgi:predicted DNA-binding transcriptional regulator AlpA
MLTERNLDDVYLPAREVWSRYKVTSMTLYRWVADPSMNFPRPVYFNRYRHWRLADLVAWETSRPRRRDTGDAVARNATAEVAA